MTSLFLEIQRTSQQMQGPLQWFMINTVCRTLSIMHAVPSDYAAALWCHAAIFSVNQSCPLMLATWTNAMSSAVVVVATASHGRIQLQQYGISDGHDRCPPCKTPVAAAGMLNASP